MLTPRPQMEKELKADEKELTDDINNLQKKVCISALPTDFNSPVVQVQIPGETIQRCPSTIEGHST